MSGINRVILKGNLTQEPESRSAGNSEVTNLNMAINRTYRSASGEQKEEVCFIGIEAWGKLAENCKRFLHKGHPILVEGRLRFSQWDDKDTGKKRNRISVTAESVHFLNSNGSGQSESADQGSGQDANDPF